MVKRWKPLVLGALTFVLAVSLKNDFLFFLFGFEIMLFAAAFFQVLLLSRRVSMEISIPEKCVFRGKPFQLRAVLTNRSVLPVPQLLARVAVRVYPEREELLMKGKLMLDSAEQGSLCFTLDSSHCSCLEVRADQLVVTDLLGLFQRRCRVNKGQRLSLYVLPENLSEPMELPDVHSTVLADDGEDARIGSAAIDVSEIRPYQPGDRVRLVHWKLSARLQSLMVREMTDPEKQRTWIYLNLQETSGKIRRNPDAWDHFVETVSMVSDALLRMEKAHMLCWVNASANRVVRWEVSETKDLEQMLCALLRADPYAPRDFSQLLKEIYADEAKGTCIEIDLQGNIIRSEKQG